jgi:hypothetical protein
MIRVMVRAAAGLPVREVSSRCRLGSSIIKIASLEIIINPKPPEIPLHRAASTMPCECELPQSW